jgi:hypothetical protein
MSQRALAEVMDRFTNDPTFRQAMKDDPESAVRDSGIELNEQEMAAIQKMNWEIPDEQLKERVSKIIYKMGP